jgi:hypothetical protein
MVVSSDSIKNATAISHGTRCFAEASGTRCGEGATVELGRLTFIGMESIGLGDRIR